MTPSDALCAHSPPFDTPPPHSRFADAPLRLISLGRLIDIDKGVFWLPKILGQLHDPPVKLTIAGDGPDRAELERCYALLGDQVFFGSHTPCACTPAVG